MAAALGVDKLVLILKMCSHVCYGCLGAACSAAGMTPVAFMLAVALVRAALLGSIRRAKAEITDAEPLPTSTASSVALVRIGEMPQSPTASENSSLRVEDRLLAKQSEREERLTQMRQAKRAAEVAEQQAQVPRISATSRRMAERRRRADRPRGRSRPWPGCPGQEGREN